MRAITTRTRLSLDHNGLIAPEVLSNRHKEKRHTVAVTVTTPLTMVSKNATGAGLSAMCPRGSGGSRRMIASTIPATGSKSAAQWAAMAVLITKPRPLIRAAATSIQNSPRHGSNGCMTRSPMSSPAWPPNSDASGSSHISNRPMARCHPTEKPTPAIFSECFVADPLLLINAVSASCGFLRRVFSNSAVSHEMREFTEQVLVAANSCSRHGDSPASTGSLSSNCPFCPFQIVIVPPASPATTIARSGVQATQCGQT